MSIRRHTPERLTPSLVAVVLAALIALAASVLPALPAQAADGGLGGRLTAAGGAPVVDSAVVVSRADWEYNAITDADGRWSVSAPDGDYRVCFGADRPDYEPVCQQVPVAAGTTRTLDRSLTARPAISGTVVRAGGAGLHTSVTALSGDTAVRTVSSDDDGRYRIGLPTGSYTLVFGAGTADVVVATRTMTLGSAGLSGRDIMLDRAPRVAGRVRDAAGAPVAGGVEVRLVGQDATVRTTVSIDGTYSVHVQPGTYRVQFVPTTTPLAPGWWTAGGPVATREAATPLTLAARGEQPDVDVELAETSALTGTVTTDLPASDIATHDLVRLYAWRQDGDTWQPVDPEGVRIEVPRGRLATVPFSVPVPAGRYRLEVVLADDRSTWYGGGSGDTATDLAVVAGKAVSGLALSFVTPPVVTPPVVTPPVVTPPVTPPVVTPPVVTPPEVAGTQVASLAKQPVRASRLKGRARLVLTLALPDAGKVSVVARKGKVRLGSGTARTAQAGRSAVTLKLGAKARRAVGTEGRHRLKVVVTWTDSAGVTQRATQTVVVRRR